ncbi:hypothetical protein [Chloroflexus sp.]|uniref:hypothetical protein n=1 Tax=Chloroflexus sp. TaxID=1904827 RepID=UPI002ACD517A|nr:hypothetical protein [Chloroflexus sp.]
MVRERLRALAAVILERGELPDVLKPFAMPLVDAALSRISEEEARNLVLHIRDHIIPWVLGDGQGSDCAQ